MARFKRLWNGKNEKHFGPLTFCLDKDSDRIGFVLDSGGGEDEQMGCHARLYLRRLTVLCELPAIISPHRSWVDMSRYDFSKPPHGYWNVDAVEYGVFATEGALHVRYGRKTHDSTTDKSKCYFMPWRRWRQVSHIVYAPDGTPSENLAFADALRHATVDALKKERFEVEDYDGARVVVKTYIEDRAWMRGSGWLRWLGYITPHKRSRSLKLEFLSEVGPEKGSWKGGMTGCGLEMRTGETSEQAMRRFCNEEHRSKGGRYKMRFIGAIKHNAMPEVPR